MPLLLEHIDAIARKKGRDVLLVVFDSTSDDIFDYKTLPARKDLIAWLKANNIEFRECADIAREDGFDSYRGQLYLDVCYDENDPLYIKLRDHLENPDGSSRIPDVMFCCLPLQIAMQNKHHDESGFWDKWIENF